MPFDVLVLGVLDVLVLGVLDDDFPSFGLASLLPGRSFSASRQRSVFPLIVVVGFGLLRPHRRRQPMIVMFLTS